MVRSIVWGRRTKNNDEEDEETEHVLGDEDEEE